MKPVMRDVEICQVPKPSGWNTGEMRPARLARILPWESLTTLSLRSKVWRNQMTMVARKITVKARVRKSLALSHRSCPTLRRPGRR